MSQLLESFSSWTVEWAGLKLFGELHVCSLLHVSILSWQVSSLGLYKQVGSDGSVYHQTL